MIYEKLLGATGYRTLRKYEILTICGCLEYKITYNRNYNMQFLRIFNLDVGFGEKIWPDTHTGAKDLAREPYRGHKSHLQVTNIPPPGKMSPDGVQPVRRPHIWQFVGIAAEIWPAAVC